jgi:death-on-curing protein
MRLITIQELVELYRLVEGGEPIFRDFGLLDAAIHRQHSSAFGVELYPTLDLKIAALMDSIARSHPLVDGNKRLTFLAAILSYQLNGRLTIVGDVDTLTNLILEISNSHLELEVIAEKLKETFVV